MRKGLDRKRNAVSVDYSFGNSYENDQTERDGRSLLEYKDVGSEEEEDLPHGGCSDPASVDIDEYGKTVSSSTSNPCASVGQHAGDSSDDEGARKVRRTADEAYEKNEPLQRLVRQRRLDPESSRSSSLANSFSMQKLLTPPRDLKVRLTQNLSSRVHAIRRFVDFTICHQDNERKFQIVKDEHDVLRLKHKDYLLRMRLTFCTTRDEDDPYVKDYVAEIKFRARLFKFNEDKDSFEEIGVISQCMAICLAAQYRRSQERSMISNV